MDVRSQNKCKSAAIRKCADRLARKQKHFQYFARAAERKRRKLREPTSYDRTFQDVMARWLMACTFAWFLIFQLAWCQTASPHLQVEDSYLHLPCVSAPSARRRRSSGNSETDNDIIETGVGSYARFSSDLQDDCSITDQQRKCRERAAKDGYSISTDLEFSDYAVSGTKRSRKGFDAALAAAAAGRLRMLYFENLGRLARESIISMSVLKTLVYVHGVRIISIDEGLDSRHDSWEILAGILSIHHEQYIKQLAKFVFRGQESAVLRDQSVGDLRYGYSSEPIPGTERGGKGRNGKPRKAYVIDATQATWVRKIFYWFVVEHQEIGWIVRELNRLRAPRDRRARSEEWNRTVVVGILRSLKYVGIWSWGKNQNHRDPNSGDKWQEEREFGETQKWVRDRPYLRLIPDEWYQEAQLLLTENQEKVLRDDEGKLRGAPNGRGARTSSKHLLSKIVQCVCGAIRYTGGKHSKYLFCKRRKNGLCEWGTQLRIDVAQERILAEVSSQIRTNSAWRAVVIANTIREHETSIAEMPSRLSDLKARITENEKIIANLIRYAESGNAPVDLTNQLERRRQELNGDCRELAVEERKAANRQPPPTEAWVDQQLAAMATSIANGGRDAGEALRNLLAGPVVLNEVRLPGQKLYFEGRFRLRTSCVLGMDGSKDENSSTDAALPGLAGDEIVVSFRVPEEFEEIADKAKAFWDSGLPYDEIAEQLNCHRNLVTRAIKFWHESRGLPAPDGRSHRKRLPSHRKAVEHQSEIMEQWKQDVPIHEIAEKFDCCQEIIREAVVNWHVERGLPPPDCRTCRRNRAADIPESDTPPPSPEGDDRPSS